MVIMLGGMQLVLVIEPVLQVGDCWLCGALVQHMNGA
jgi:hypothetical protein